VVVDAVEGVEEVTHTDVAVPKFPHLETGRFINAYQSFSEDFRLRAYEVGFDQGASIVSIGNIIQVMLFLESRVSYFFVCVTLFSERASGFQREQHIQVTHSMAYGIDHLFR
jgi:hypothetical protein